MSHNLLLASQPLDAHDRAMWLDVMLDLAYLALVTDTTRAITFEWSREAGGYGGGGENHHELSHHGGDLGMLAKLAAIDRFHLVLLYPSQIQFVLQSWHDLTRVMVPMPSALVSK